MLRAELFKILTHRLPKSCLGVTLLGVVGPSLAMLFYTPETPSAYATTFRHVYEILPSVAAVAFGSWILGVEYRQGTVNRAFLAEPRRLRTMGAKAAAGSTALFGALAIVAVGGWSVARLVGEANDYTVAWSGRQLLPGALFAMGAAAAAFALSVILRSDALAMVSTLALVLILDPLLGLIPRVGKFTFARALETLTSRAGGSAGGLFDTALLSNTQASITLVVWFAVLLGLAGYLLTTRDV